MTISFENFIVIIALFLIIFVVMTGVQLAIMVFTQKNTTSIYIGFVCVLMLIFLCVLSVISA